VGTVYPPEFKAQVVQLAREGEKSYVEIARELGLSPTSVANWVREADAKQRRGGLSGVDPVAWTRGFGGQGLNVAANSAGVRCPSAAWWRCRL
jgi:transposase-like protein